MTALPMSAFRRHVDLSTAHMTERDNELLAEFADADNPKAVNLPRITGHEHGWIIFVNSDDEHLKTATEAMFSVGFSAAFVTLYQRACASGPDVMLINFDSAADEIPGLPTFDW